MYRLSLIEETRMIAVLLGLLVLRAISLMILMVV